MVMVSDHFAISALLNQNRNTVMALLQIGHFKVGLHTRGLSLFGFCCAFACIFLVCQSHKKNINKWSAFVGL